MNKKRAESLVARLCLWSLAAALLANLLPKEAFSNRFIVGGVTATAAVLLVAWILLMGLHLYRMLFDKSCRYSLGQVLAVLFIPVLGAVVVSLRKVARTAKTNR